MLICVNCEIEVEEGQEKCPKCGGSLDEILDEEVEEGLEEDEGFGDEEPAGEPQAAEAGKEAAPAGAGAPAGGGEAPAGAAAGAEDKKDREERKKDRIRDRKSRPEKAERPGKDRKGKTDRKPKETVPEKPKPPKSIWLSQRRAPVLLASVMMLFFSLYMIADCVIAFLMSQNHPMQAFLGAGGLLAAAFLYGHGKLGRWGAILIGVMVLAASVYFKTTFNLENYAFIFAVVCFNLMLAVTLFGKGWFLRTAAGFVLSVPVVVGCLISLVFDFIPVAASKQADEALDIIAKAEATLDLAKIEEARATAPVPAMEMYKEILGHLDKVPFDKIPEKPRGIIYMFMGRLRISRMYFKPVTLQKKVFMLSPDLLPQTNPEGEDLALEGGAWTSIPKTGIEQGSVKILKPGFKPKDQDDIESVWFTQGLDYEIEYGGVAAQTRIRRMATGNMPETGKFKVFYMCMNDQRDAVLEEAMTYVRKAKDFVTGAAPGQIGPVLGEIYGKQASGGKLVLDANGQSMLEHFLYFDAQHIWLRADAACKAVEEGLKGGDRAKVEEGSAKGKELIEFFDNELFNTLGWMIQKMDAADSPGDNAEKILGSDEYPFLYYNNARVYWNLYLASERKTEADFEQARSRMIQMKEIITNNEPVKFRQQAEKIVARYLNRDVPLWVNRWRKAVELDDLILAEQDRIAAAKGEGPEKDVPKDMGGWDRSSGADGGGISRNSVEGNSVTGKAVKFHLEIRDPGNLLEGKSLPSFRDFQLRRNRVVMEIGIVTAGQSGGKIKFAFKSITCLDKEGEEAAEPKFNLVNQLEWVGEHEKFFNPEINYDEIEETAFKAIEAVRIVMEISRGE